MEASHSVGPASIEQDVGVPRVVVGAFVVVWTPEMLSDILVCEDGSAVQIAVTG